MSATTSAVSIRRLVWLGSVALATGWASSVAAVSFVGTVYVGTNKLTGNTLAGFGRNSDGTLTPIAEYATGGLGGNFANGAPVNPLIAADAVVNVNNRFVLAVNAGSNPIS